MSKKTRVLPVSDPRAIEQAKMILSQGGLVVFPTDTLYGLACDFPNTEAIQAIYEAKGRSAAKALPVLISNQSQLPQLVQAMTPSAEKLMRRYWPGPLTLVLPKLDLLPDILTPYPGLAVRMPSLPFALALLEQTGPLAVTSANLSDNPNPVNAEGVYAQLNGKIDLLLDGGELSASPGSTIVDCTTDQVRLIREGVIPFQEILEFFQD